MIVFTRYPEPGRTKTRLIPALGPAGAANLQRELTEETVDRVRMIGPWCDKEIRTEGGSPEEFRKWLGEDFLLRPQGDGDLGLRLTRAFHTAFDEGCSRVVAVGIDAPMLRHELIEEALNRLGEVDCVLGPATDGGYYLIGMSRLETELFADISWGTGEVLEETRARASAAELSIHLLAELPDVDRPEDLWQTERISVVVPTKNEKERIADLVKGLVEAECEVIVVDGSSEDGTAEAAETAGAKVVTYPGADRFSQMDAGAAEATGRYLFFLYADTQPPQNFPEIIRKTLKDDEAAAGAFSYGLDASGLGFRLVEWAVNLRARFAGIIFGDQGVFLKKSSFRAAGGFSGKGILADYELVRELRKNGRVVFRSEKVTTSARRWQQNGFWKTFAVHQKVLWGYLFGAQPERLSRWRAELKDER